MATIVGQQIALTADRSVFVGRIPGEPSYFLRFQSHGAVTRIKLSPPAALALRTLLYTDESRGEPRTYETDERAEHKWVLVADADKD